MKVLRPDGRVMWSPQFVYAAMICGGSCGFGGVVTWLYMTIRRGKVDP